jgi:polar amino acid transport system substrate-binding protein
MQKMNARIRSCIEGRARQALVAGLLLGLIGAAAAFGASAQPISARAAQPAAVLEDVCSGQPLLDKVKKAGVLKVAAGTGPPNTFPDVRTGAWVGIDSYVLGAVAKRIGVKVRASFGPVAAIVPAIQSGRADVTSGLFKNAQRAQVADFSTAFKWATVNVYVKQGDTSVNSLEDLKGKTLGAASGTAELVAANALVAQGLAKGVVVAQTAPGPLDLLADGRVDAIVLQNLLAQFALTRNPGRYRFKAAAEVEPKWFGQATVTASYYLVQKTPCNVTLLDAINATVRSLRANGGMAKIFKKYGVNDPKVYTPPPGWVD